METVNENIGLLEQISQLSRLKKGLIKQVITLKSGMEDTQNELKRVKKTIRMLNSGIITLY